MTGAELIAEERREQIEKHGFSIIEDAEYYKSQELIAAALFCIDGVTMPGSGLMTYKRWPESWGQKFKDKIIKKDRIGQLKVAGAFIAAEIDRLKSLAPDTFREDSEEAESTHENPEK